MESHAAVYYWVCNKLGKCLFEEQRKFACTNILKENEIEFRAIKHC